MATRDSRTQATNPNGATNAKTQCALMIDLLGVTYPEESASDVPPETAAVRHQPNVSQGCCPPVEGASKRAEVSR
jgi:hypothetical protein